MKLRFPLYWIGTAGLAVATPSGLNNIPTADTTPQGTFVFQLFSTMGNDRDTDLNFGFKSGLDSKTRPLVLDTQDILCYCGTSREGSLLRFYLRYVAGYPKVRLYEGAWKEYVWSKTKASQPRPDQPASLELWRPGNFPGEAPPACRQIVAGSSAGSPRLR